MLITQIFKFNFKFMKYITLVIEPLIPQLSSPKNGGCKLCHSYVRYVVTAGDCYFPKDNVKKV